MKAVTEHTGRAVVLRRSNVDTDQIIPAEYCKRLTKSGYADALFAGWRADPHFVLNQPANTGASVLVAQHNFGTGSSREHAVWALRDWGFVAVVATSFGDIFHRNAFKNGLLAIELPAPAVDWLASAIERDPGLPITVNLRRCEIGTGGMRYPFTVAARARELLLDGMDEIAVTLGHDASISTYERARAHWLPSIGPTAPSMIDAGVS
ncbi:3-isopropylmalate dehydratase small subunit [Nocardia brasiliensis]|uniref:3-isopropylmalate dehydratase small subunit n=1 Tax=Nocardia brasiliensis TaxID=37326 RepID=UPI0037A7684D